jgi:7-cyano-7-deazaguanine synthase
MKRHAVVSLSGGMDSSTLLLRCLQEYDTVTAVSFDYGQKHKVELERARSLVDYINENYDSGISEIDYEVIKLDGLSKLLNSSLVEGGDEVPEGHYEDENMKATVVPNRNKIFSSIVQAIALSISGKTKEECHIALGIHAGDHDIYPDCRQEFRDADDVAFRMGNWDANMVQYFTPYMEYDKFNILQDGEILCGTLGLDFDEVYKRTMTSYKPIFIPHTNIGGEIWGDWFADYKSASSIERIEAFIKLKRKDPSSYADETGPVGWEVAREHAQNVLENYPKLKQ